MAAPALKQSAIIPDLPRSPRVIDDNGELVSEWKLFFDQLLLALQNTLTREGFVFPQQTDSNIALLTGVQSLANILYDSTNNVFMGNVQTAPNTYTWKEFLMA